MRQVLLIPGAAYAEVTFFANRADWKAEGSIRGFRFAAENFDAFLDRSERPSFTVGDVQFTRVDGVLQNGELTAAFGTAVRFGGRESGTIEGPIGGIGMDLDVAENAERNLNISPLSVA